MQTVYAREPVPSTLTKSVFLAGPTPRPIPGIEPQSWRNQALTFLDAAGFEGTVFVPEPADGKWAEHYEAQVEWEEEGLHKADLILFWVPRNMETLPGLTTNIEWGVWCDSGKVMLGYPDHAKSMRYLRHYADKYKVPVFSTFQEIATAAVAKLGAGAERTGGERDVPLHIWKTPSFQAWYRAQREAGNRLDGARVLWTFRVGPGRDYVFAWVLHVNVWITSENRAKVNEFVLSRTDISTIVAFRRSQPRSVSTTENNLLDTEIALIREFRSPARTPDGFVRECPGGSSFKPGKDPLVLAASELEEETGLKVNPGRFVRVGGRQVAGTLSAHHADVFAVPLEAAEFDRLKADAANAHGVIEDSERTYVEVTTLGEILRARTLDWSNIGMICQALLG